MKKKMITTKDITPEPYACPPLPVCPSIHITARGTYVVIGKKISDLDMMPDVKKKIGESIRDQSGLVDPVLGNPSEYSQGFPSKIVRANCTCIQESSRVRPGSDMVSIVII